MKVFAYIAFFFVVFKAQSARLRFDAIVIPTVGRPLLHFFAGEFVHIKLRISSSLELIVSVSRRMSYCLSSEFGS